MSTINEFDLIEKQEMRSKFLERIDILETVGELLTLPNTDLMTTKMVAEFYQVGFEAIKTVYKRNREELVASGAKTVEGLSLKDLKAEVQDAPSFSYAKSIVVFSKRAVLNVGMLLRDSPVSKELRSQILNTMEVVPDEVKTQAIEQEQKLLLDIIYAKDEVERAVCLSEFNNYKNRHIAQLNAQIEEQTPLYEFSKEVLSAEGVVPTTQIAKEYGMSAQALNKILNFADVIYKKGRQWYLYAQYQNKGYMKSETVVENGIASVHNQWTQLGRKFIHEKMKELGYVDGDE